MGYARTKIMGVLNVTPDSFSDGGKFFRVDDALRHAEELVTEGADVIDVGAESSAPGAAAISQKEELDRLRGILPEVIDIAHSSDVEVSLDTRNARTAAWAIGLGVDYINDVGGLMDSDMAPTLAKSDEAKIIVMHNFGIPVSHVRQEPDTPEQLMGEMIEWLGVRIDTLVSSGVDRQRIIIDPGLGFGKAPKYSWHITRNISQFRVLGLPICIGHSRKSMLTAVMQAESQSRDLPTAIVSTFLLQQEIELIRVHNVPLNKLALDIAQMLLRPALGL
ncbi:MAG: dihydropteroate synthase [Anaplasma sp.]